MAHQVHVVSWNVEGNGSGDPARRREAHQFLADLQPHLVYRQEMWDAADDGSTILYELEEILGLRGWLGDRSCNAVFADPQVFAPAREWPGVGPMWHLPPMALSLRLRAAGPESMPLVVCSHHLSYASPTSRKLEAEWLTSLADKDWPLPDGRVMKLPALIAGDHNSYPVPRTYPDPATVSDPPLPQLWEIHDLPHRSHRSYVGRDETRVMDTRPDEVLHTAGFEDVARHLAITARQEGALEPTVSASHTQGRAARIDRIYATTSLLDAVTSVDVIAVPQRLSDHHIVRVRLDASVLTEILRYGPAA
jgi:endonuclease/exonuclease/phosphatase family metal-dependent hydrolase